MPDRNRPQSQALVRRLDPSVFAPPARTAPRRTGEELHICPCCDSDLVYPVDWSPAPGKRWNVDLRCPNCEWICSGVYAQEVVDRFDAALDIGTEILLEDLALLARANMEEQVDAFVAALSSDRILPEDF